MAHQINLYSPILLQPQRHFSALAMLQALAVLLLGLLALGGWAAYSTQRLRQELADTRAGQSADRQRLQAALAAKPTTAQDLGTHEQELARARQAVAERQALLDEWRAPGRHISRATTLRLMAQTAPDRLWLTEVRLADGHLELAGVSLQPEQLRPWLGTLLAQPALQGLLLHSVLVDTAAVADGPGPGWSFRIVAQAAAGPAPISGGRAP